MFCEPHKRVLVSGATQLQVCNKKILQKLVSLADIITVHMLLQFITVVSMFVCQTANIVLQNFPEFAWVDSIPQFAVISS